MEFGAHADSTIEQVIKEARRVAGPPEARIMIGQEFGGLKVINQEHFGSQEESRRSSKSS